MLSHWDPQKGVKVPFSKTRSRHSNNDTQRPPITAKACFHIRKLNRAGYKWLMLVVLAIQEAETKRIEV
jgi:hypothetical protein